MIARAGAVLRAMAIALLTVAYAVLAHLSNSHPGAENLGVCLAVAPVLLIAVVIIWRSGLRVPALLLGPLGAILVYRHLPFLQQHFTWVYLSQQAAVYALLAFSFGRTLSGGRIPLCSQLAAFVHGPLGPDMARYTRAVTVGWTVFFIGMTAALLILYAAAPLRVWSLFANFCTLPLIIAMFVGEYAVRIRVLPQMKHATILQGVRAYLASHGEGRAMRRG